MAKKSKKQLNRFVHPQLSNASKTLLANIRFASVDEKVKTLVITSSMSNEGKTIVATNLANAIATSGKRVLIVDCDMRRRCIGRLLDIHPANGIYAVMTGEATLNETIMPTSIPNLYFMDSEPNIPSPPDILSTKRFASLVDKLRDLFDYVIFDTPPVSLFVDAAVLSSLVDGTIVVARQRQTKRSALVKTIQQLRTAQARILGTVVTFCNDDDSNYYYAYYTVDGKRVNKEEATSYSALPNEISNASSNPWDPAPAGNHRPAATRGDGAANLYAPNAYKSVAATEGKVPRHKNRRP